MRSGSPPPPEEEGETYALDEQPLLSGVTRRWVLRVGGVGGALAATGWWLFGSLKRISPPGAGLRSLTRGELEIAEKIGEAFFPGPPVSPLTAAEVDLAGFVDRYLADMYPSELRLFKILFRVLNLSPVVGYARTFYWLPLADRQEVLEAWARSDVLARRAGYQSLRFIFSMGYFESSRVRAALGLTTGCEGADRSVGS